MKLPAGATGFTRPGQAVHYDARPFLTACHDAARRTGGTITTSQEPGVTPNFHAVVIAYGHERLAVLRHALLPLAAFAQAPRDHVALPPAFIDHPRLAQIIGESTGCPVLSTAELRQPLKPADLSQLTTAEHEQIRYWKPATVGELLFNYWD